MSTPPKKIYISDEIQNLLVTRKSYYAELFMFGMNAKGVIVEAVRLAKNGGCEMMPGISQYTMSYAYRKLAKMKLIPAAFGYRTNHEQVLTTDIYKFPNTPFICSTDNHRFDVSCPTGLNARGRATHINHNYEVGVVPKDYDPLKPVERIAVKATKKRKAKATQPHRVSAVKRKPRTRVRTTSAKPKHKEVHRGKR